MKLYFFWVSALAWLVFVQIIVADVTQVQYDSKDKVTNKLPALEASSKGLIVGVPRAASKEEYIRNSPPVYPQEARSRNQEGLVILLVEINEKGSVEKIRISKSSGFKTLDHAAENTVKKWILQPAQLDGIAIPSIVKVLIRFDLKD